jgi:uncharacterized membrane protein YheB (UPF0754 family)
VTEEKKVTEIIQEIKIEVAEILAYIRNMDLKYTLILDRLNKLTSSPITPSNSVKLESPEIIFPEHNPVVKSNLKSKLQSALEQAQRDQEDEDQIIVATQQDRKRRNLRQHAENQNRQIPTHQRIVYSDNKPVYMANVEIIDVVTQNLVKQTKTNQTGKWLAPLVPGEYQIKVSKGSNSLKSKVELDYRVTIPNQDSTVDLGTKTVE